MTDTTDWMKRILAPVIVAVAVGMATSYLSTAVAMSRMDEKASAQAVRVADHAVRIKALEDGKLSVVALEVEVRGIREQLMRMENKLDRINP